MSRIFRPLKNRRRAAVLSLGLAFAAALAAAAAGGRDEAEELSLAGAVELALAGHPEILLVREEAKAAAARRRQAEARPDPRLTFGTAGIPWTLKAGEVETEYALGVEREFEYPGLRAARVEIARRDEEAASLEIERTGLLLAARVKKAYHQAVFAEETRIALESLGAVIDRLTDALLVRFESGEAAYADVLRAKVEKARLQNRLIEARRDESSARTGLLLFLGFSPDKPVRLTDRLAVPPLEASLDRVLAEAGKHRPSLRLARLRRSRAEAEVRMASLAAKPGFEAGLFVPSKNIKGWGFSLGISLPLSSSRTGGLQAEAAAAREKSLIETVAVERRLDILVRAAYREARAAEEQVEVFEKRLLGEIEAEIENGLTQYCLGRIEAYALLDLFRSLAEARLEHLQARFLYAVALAGMDAAGEDGE